MAHTVIGVFNTAADAQRAVQQLESNGFQRDYVDVAPYEGSAGGSSHGSTSTNTTGTRAEAAVDNAGDSISNFFSNLFGDDDNNTAHNYSNVLRSGKSLVTVHAQSASEAERARDLLDEYGAVDVDDMASQYGSGTSNTGNAYAGNQNQGATAQTGDANTLKVVEEQMQVGKRVEQTGGVRVRSRIVERPVEEHLRLREEHVHVERHAVNRPATEADFNAFKEGEMEITESAERAVVGKEARVVEEISLGKEVTEREETVRDTVRKTEVDIEQINDATRTNNPNNTNDYNNSNRNV